MRKQSSAIHVAYNCSLVSSEGSPPIHYPRKGPAKRPFSSEACVSGRDVE
jgi:hypothetical protein